MKSSGWQVGVLLAIALVALAAAGCTGTDFTPTGNAPVSIELVVSGDTAVDWDCILFEFETIRYRPLDGTCGADSTNPGDVCLNDTDCDPGTGPGTCEGSKAGELIGNLGILASDNFATVKGNLLVGPCETSHAALEQFVGADEIVLPPSLVLSEGLYEISLFGIANVGLYEDDPVLDNVDVRLCQGQTPVSTLLGDALRFTIPATTDKALRFELHADVLEQVFQFGFGNCPALANNLADILTCETCDAGIP
jgi:hypothetical protein